MTIRSFTPLFLVKIYRRFKSPASREFLWEGIYQHYNQIVAVGGGYEGAVWINSRASSTRDLLDASKSFGLIPGVIESRYGLLAFLASALSRSSNKVRILDFGGAMGIAYVYLCGSMTNSQLIDYYVVDNQASCEQGSKIFEGDNRIHFETSLPETIDRVDIVFMSGVLQYVEDYEGVILRVIKYKPAFVLLTLLPVGEAPTFAAAQKNLQGSILPSWFFNLIEIIELMRNHGYRMSFKGAAEPKFDMGNFPPEYRLTHMANLLFSSTRSIPPMS